MENFAEFNHAFRGDWDEIVATVIRLEWLDLASTIRFEEMVNESYESQCEEYRTDRESLNNDDAESEIELEVSALEPDSDSYAKCSNSDRIQTIVQSEEFPKESVPEPELELLKFELNTSELKPEPEDSEVNTEPEPEPFEMELNTELEPNPEESETEKGPEPKPEESEMEKEPEPDESEPETKPTKPRSKPLIGSFRQFWKSAKDCFLCCIPRKKHRKNVAKSA